MTAELRKDERVFLIPKTLGCPSICWSRPQGTVVDVNRNEYYVKVLVDGETTPRRMHQDNVVRNLSAPRAESPAPKGPRRKARAESSTSLTAWKR